LALSILSNAGINCAQATGRAEARMLLSAYVGEANAQNFIGYVKSALTMPNMEALLKDPNNHPLPEQTDQMYTLGNSLAFHATEKNADDIATVINRMPEELKERVLKDLLNKKPHLGAHKAFVALAVKGSHIVDRAYDGDAELFREREAERIRQTI
jgi:hypothetical protein